MTLQPFRIASKLSRLKMVVAYTRVMKTLREAATPEATSTEEPKKRKAAKKR